MHALDALTGEIRWSIALGERTGRSGQIRARRCITNRMCSRSSHDWLRNRPSGWRVVEWRECAAVGAGPADDVAAILLLRAQRRYGSRRDATRRDTTHIEAGMSLMSANFGDGCVERRLRVSMTREVARGGTAVSCRHSVGRLGGHGVLITLGRARASITAARVEVRLTRRHDCTSPTRE